MITTKIVFITVISCQWAKFFDFVFVDGQRIIVSFLSRLIMLHFDSINKRIYERIDWHHVEWNCIKMGIILSNKNKNICAKALLQPNIMFISTISVFKSRLSNRGWHQWYHIQFSVECSRVVVAYHHRVSFHTINRFIYLLWTRLINSILIDCVHMAKSYVDWCGQDENFCTILIV